MKWDELPLDKAPVKNRDFDGAHRRLITVFFLG